MKKEPFIKSIFYMIINFFKMLFLYVIKFILIIFGLEDKEEKVNKEIIVVTEELKSGKKEIREPSFSVPVDPSSLTVEDDNHPDEIKKKKETVVYKHISNEKNGNIRIFTITNEMLDRIIDSYIEEKEEVKVLKFDKDLKEDYKDWKKEIIFPQIKVEFEKKYIKDADTLTNSVQEILEVELEVQHKKLDKEKEKLIDNKPLTKKDKKDKETIIVDFKRELLPEKRLEVEEVVISKEVTEEVIKETTPTSLVVDEKKDEIKLSDEINNILLASSLVVTNVEKALVEKKVEEKKKDKNEKEKVVEEVIDEVTPEVIVESKEEKVEIVEPIEVVPVITEDVKEEKKDEVKVTLDKDDKIDDIDEIMDEEIVEIQVKEVEVDNKKVQQEEIVIKQIDLPSVDINEDVIVSKVKDESYKEDIEDRDYDSLENKIDEALEKIEMFIVMNEGKLTPKQLEQLNKEKEKLELTKEKINKQRDLDIEVERKEVEFDIQRSEIAGLQNALEQMELENKMKMNEMLINKLEDLELMSDARAREIEKQLLKLKLRQACRALSIPSLVALPFIRNKYFFFFTIGLFVNRNLGFIGDVFRRHTREKQEEELNNLITGKDALNGAINTMRENIDYLNVLEEQAMMRYPELIRDSEYLHYINSLKHKLNANYQRLTRRQNTIDRLIVRNKKNIKVLKRKKNKYYKNAA